jgi:hypothetical protein
MISLPHGKDVCELGTIVDEHGKFCGSIHLYNTFITESLDDPREFIILSEACDTMGGSAIENRMVPDKSKWDIYWVMLVKWDEPVIMAERRGIGQIF